KSIDTITCSIYQHSRRTVNHVSSSYLRITFLQKIFEGDWSAYLGYTSIDRENSSYRYIYIYIGRAVQWIHEYDVFVVDSRSFYFYKFIIFFRTNSAYNLALSKRIYKNIVGNNV